MQFLKIMLNQVLIKIGNFDEAYDTNILTCSVFENQKK